MANCGGDSTIRKGANLIQRGLQFDCGPGDSWGGLGEPSARFAARVCLPALLACAALFAAACGGPSQPPEQHYHLEGKIEAIDRQHQQLLVDHKEIPGFMDAMAMAYSVKTPLVLDQVSVGDQITADLVVSGTLHWLENIKVVKKADPNAAPASPTPPQVREPQPGDDVPNFVLLNQDGKQIHLADFHGQSVLLTFIYTRCPLADYCPAMSTRFSVIEEALQKNKQALGKTHLLSISFDPKNDSPKVLRAYGTGYLQGAGEKDFRHWEFAVAPKSNLKDVAAFFGLAYMPDEKQFVHSMSTAIISPSGKIFKWYGGIDWQTSDVMKDLLSSIGG
jgi:protein SCO1/2